MMAGKKQQRLFSLKFKLLAGFTLIFTLVFAVAFYWFSEFTTSQALRRIEEDMVNTLIAAANGVDGDELQALYTEDVPKREDGYTDDPRYWSQVAWLAEVRRIEPRAHLYTYIRGEKRNELIYITSTGAVEEPPFGVTFLEHSITENEPFNYKGLEKRVRPAIQASYKDEWGRWISAYTPVKNSTGEIIAGLGVDFEADYVDEVQQAIRNRVAFAFVIVYGTLFLLVYWLSSTLAGPISSLTQSAERIGEGDYDQDLSILKKSRLSDEIDVLVEVFGLMLDKVKQREQKLKAEVQQLQIEIDQTKREKQVSDIVDTDFFQDLSARAAEMRRRTRERRDK